MIDNIILLITGTLHQRPISELVPKCHKLGSFEQMEAIHVAATPAELYNAVLVGKLFSKVTSDVLKLFWPNYLPTLIKGPLITDGRNSNEMLILRTGLL